MHSAVLEHPHHAGRMHHAAAVGQAHSAHHRVTDPPAAGPVATAAVTPATSTTFSVVAQFSNASFLGTAAITDNDIWAVGYSTATGTEEPLAVHFDGTSWSAVSTPTLSGGGLFRGVTAVASNDVWAVGTQLGSTDEPLIEHWDGTSWSVVSSPPTGSGSLSAVSADASNDVWAAGSEMLHWDGTSWSVVSSSTVVGLGGSGVSADASNDVWAVGGNAISHFDGTSWTRTVLPPALYGGPALFGVAALSPSNVWAVGMVRPSSAFEWRPLTEHWNGTSWSQVGSPDPNPKIGYNLRAIAAISASDIWAAGTVNIEHWDGTSWSIVSAAPSGVSGALHAVAALSDGTVVIVSSGGTIIEN